jgi:hypothetical protein
MEEHTKNLISTIKGMKNKGVLNKYIDFIHFPYYRNMEINSRINFDFPLTVIVGQNGCGKSSVLHAISGMPKGKTPSRFWFDTEVDPIIYYDDEKRRHSFWYQFKEKGQTKQVVKARIKRIHNPNNWETNRPLLWAGMKPEKSGFRTPPIDKDLIYIDFRSELSAFDKFFHFGYLKKEEAKNKQEFIRNNSGNLSKAFSGEIIKNEQGKDMNRLVEIIDKNELKAISFILGREYSEAKSVYHSFFRNPGYSILFKTNHAKYSEAFAGSGETAVVRLVKEVLSASNNSLILLDEPEVSLHPGAQRRLTTFLLNEIKKKKHQIILTTHSPALIKDLPKEAIKVLCQNPDTGRFSVKENLFPEEAFYHIEFNNDTKKKLYFEDKLAREIFQEVIDSLGVEKANLFSLIYNPGGCTTINKEFITVFCREYPSINYVIFDGDQKLHEPYDWRSLAHDKLTVDNLKKKVKDLTNTDIAFSVDGGYTGGNENQKIELYKKYLDYYLTNVFYLPKNIPEDIIWNTDTAKNFISGIYPEEVDDKLKELSNITNLKERFSLLCKFIHNENTSDMIFILQKIFIRAWIQKRDESYNLIVSIIDKILI